MRNSNSEFQATDLPPLIVTATNLALAVEIYLKICLVIDGKEPPQHHILWKLFRVISNSNRDTIENEFSIRYAEIVNDGGQHGIILQLRISGYDHEDLDNNSSIVADCSKIDLSDILKASKSTFYTWRYVYEILGNSKFTEIRLDFSAFDLLCEILDAGIAVALVERR